MPTYTYGMKGAPRVGNGLGGLPKKAGGSSTTLATTLIYDSGSADFKVPAGFSQIRITAIGPGGSSAGGSGGYNGGAGGGALAATNIVKVVEGDIVSYTVGSPGTPGLNGPATAGTPTTVKFKAYSLVAGAGGPTIMGGSPFTGGIGGTASGGDVNFPGGDGGVGAGAGYGGGGGAAGFGSNGGGGGNFNGAAANPPNVTSGDLAGGGGGASGPSIGGAGGGSGARGSFAYDGSNYLPPPQNITPSRFTLGLSPVNAQSSSRMGAVGGQAGGGAGAGSYLGGSGCVRIELWP